MHLEDDGLTNTAPQAADAGQDDREAAKKLRDEAARHRIAAREAREATEQAKAELQKAQLTLARLRIQAEDARMSDDIIARLCHANTPEAVAEWAAAFGEVIDEAVAERLETMPKAPAGNYVVRDMIRANARGGGQMKTTSTGLEGVAAKLKR